MKGCTGRSEDPMFHFMSWPKLQQRAVEDGCGCPHPVRNGRQLTIINLSRTESATDRAVILSLFHSRHCAQLPAAIQPPTLTCVWVGPGPGLYTKGIALEHCRRRVEVLRAVENGCLLTGPG